MADHPKSACHKGCKNSLGGGFGGYMPLGKGRTLGIWGKKGNRYECMQCKSVHIFNDAGEFLGFGE